MDKSLRFSLISIASVIALSSSLDAQSLRSPPPPFEEADVDHDNVLDIDEANQAFVTLVFEDLDNDGILTKREAEYALPGLVYTRDTHEDAREPIGLTDYLQMADFYVTGKLRPIPLTNDGNDSAKQSD